MHSNKINIKNNETIKKKNSENERNFGHEWMEHKYWCYYNLIIIMGVDLQFV